MLTANATRGCFIGQMDEQAFHLRIFDGEEPSHRQNASTASHSTPTKSHPGIAHISRFLGSFVAQIGHGDHICFIFEVLGPNTLALWTASDKPGLNLLVVKAIVKQSLLALDYLHASCGIIHCGKPVLISLSVDPTNMLDTDIKPENILLNAGTDSLSSSSMDPEYYHHLAAAVQPTSQPLPVTPRELDNFQIKIADFGHCDYSSILRRCSASIFFCPANWTDMQFHNEVGALPMLPPELLLGLPGAMTPAVDIWAFGCTESPLLLQLLFRVIPLILPLLDFLNCLRASGYLSGKRANILSLNEPICSL